MLPLRLLAPLLLLATPATIAWPAAATTHAAPPASVTVELGVPMLLNWVAPVYPPSAAEQKLEGRVYLRLIIDENGTVTRARVARSTVPAGAAGRSGRLRADEGNA
jgi:outer membrane biosynthesis protein TonB